MKALLILATLTLITATSFGEMIYRPGYVQEGSCGFNIMVPSPGQLPGKRPMMDYVSRICAVSVQGLNSKTPLYSFDIVTAHDFNFTIPDVDPSSPVIITADVVAKTCVKSVPLSGIGMVIKSTWFALKVKEVGICED